MTDRNRECIVQVHDLTRVCTYCATVCICTCTKSAPRHITKRHLTGPWSR